MGPFFAYGSLIDATLYGTTSHSCDLSCMTVDHRDFGFYAFVGGCLLGAIVLFSLLVGGEVSGPSVAQVPTHSSQPHQDSGQ